MTGYIFWPLPKPAESVAVNSALGDGDSAGYQRAYEPRVFQFPVDHGPHPEFRNEWWYVTGNLAHATGRQFGYQLTLFRIALAPTPPIADSAWRTNQVYMGHFALTDVATGQHHAFERFSRDSVGLAGAQFGRFGGRASDTLSGLARRLGLDRSRIRYISDTSIRPRRQSRDQFDAEYRQTSGIARESGLEPEKRRTGQRFLLLLLHAATDGRHGPIGRNNFHGEWRKLAGPGMEYQRAGAGTKWLGLVRIAAR